MSIVKIGNVEIKGKVVLAPMAGVCAMTFREICKKKGAALVCAEMVNTTALVHKNQKSFAMLAISPSEHPISMQIFGNDAAHFAEVAKWVEENVACDIIDINMGCPVRKVAERAKAGSALTRDLQKVEDVVRAVVSNTTKPVTVKYRLGWDKDSINCVEVAKLVEKCGASAITLHARTRADMYSGDASEAWDYIKQVKESVSIPVIGNGDVKTPEDAKRMLEQTGCDLVMMARGAQGNPWIFNQVQQYLDNGTHVPPPSFEEWKETIIEHTTGLMEQWGDRNAFSQMRGHGVHYMSGLVGVSEYKRRMGSVTSLEEIIDILNDCEPAYRGSL